MKPSELFEALHALITERVPLYLIAHSTAGWLNIGRQSQAMKVAISVCCRITTRKATGPRSCQKHHDGKWKKRWNKISRRKSRRRYTLPGSN